LQFYDKLEIAAKFR